MNRHIAMSLSWLGLALALALGSSGCGTSPEITSTTVTPAAFTSSGAVSSANFAVSCNVLHFSGNVTSVKAVVEGQSITLDLAKESGTLGDET